MRHLRAGRKLGMTSSHRMAMLRNMVTSLIEHERIQTTDTRAKELKRLADKMITLGKRGDLHARRQAMRIIRQKSVAKKLFDEVAPRFQDKQGGYTRIIRMGQRRGDAAQQAILEWVDLGGAETEEAPVEETKAPAKS